MKILYYIGNYLRNINDRYLVYMYLGTYEFFNLRKEALVCPAEDI